MCAGLAVLGIRIWRHQRSDPARWLAIAFGSATATIGVALALPATISHPIGPGTPLHWLIKGLLAGLLLFPWFLLRFQAALEPLPARLDRVTNALAATMVLATLALPSIPATHDHRRPWWLVAFLVVAVAEWGSLSVGGCVRFWRAGRGQPSVVRRRMQVLSLASALLVASLVPAVEPSSNNTNSVAHLLGLVIGIGAALLFWLGFSPPALLRQYWRRPEESALRRAEIGLMGSVTVDAVARSLLPHLGGVFGGRAAVLMDRGGKALGAHAIDADADDAIGGAGDAGIAAITALTPQILALRPGSGPAVIARRFITLALVSGYLTVETGAYTPFFGREESDLLTNLAAFVELALARADLFERERVTRSALERAHKELESLVYSFSHDLKSPLISMLGYLDYLNFDHRDGLGETGGYYLDRMKASALYMTDLIQGLLDLSRIGRTQTEVEDVDLQALVEDIAEGLADLSPQASVIASGLPTIAMNGVRARELFTNLVENAVKHGRRTDIRVTVTAAPGPDGSLRILVTDNGRGIPAQYRERIFGIFERLDGPTSDSDAGTGIGLAICKKIVEQAEGRISAADVERGAQLCIELPGRVVRPTPIRQDV